MRHAAVAIMAVLATLSACEDHRPASETTAQALSTSRAGEGAIDAIGDGASRNAIGHGPSGNTTGVGDDVSPTDAGADGAGAALSIPSHELHVPRAAAAIVPTGQFRVTLWQGAPSTGVLRDRDGRGAVPVSEARVLWRDRTLYFFVYAGDLDLQAHATRHDSAVWKDDSIVWAFGGAGASKRILQISVTGVSADGLCPEDAIDLSDPRCDLKWESGVRAATDLDGTLNRIHDRDEEWAVEAAIPLAALDAGSTPGTAIALRMSRCEIAYDGPRACGAWEGTLRLDDRAPSESGGLR